MRDGPGPRWAGPCGPSLCPFASGRSALPGPAPLPRDPRDRFAEGPRRPPLTQQPGRAWCRRLRGAPPSTHGPRFDPRRRLQDWLVGLRTGRSGARAGALALGLGGVAVGRRIPPGRCAGGTAGAGGGPIRCGVRSPKAPVAVLGSGLRGVGTADLQFGGFRGLLGLWKSFA